MNNSHITRFGNPTTRLGARYIVSDEEGLFQMAVELEHARLDTEGIVITPRLQARTIDRVRRDRLVLNDMVSSMGIPENIRDLMRITEKSETIKYCRESLISEFELFLLIHNCNQIGFNHRSKFPRYEPPHLKITGDDTESLHKGNIWPFTKKIRSIFLERRNIHVHLFQRESEWHCFYFSESDILSDPKSHWVNGCHLHYVSYLWPNYTYEQIWGLFDTRHTDISGKLHIRFAPFVYPESGTHTNAISPNPIEQSAVEIASFSDLNPQTYSMPIPIAQVATRGIWVQDVSVPSREPKNRSDSE